MTIPKFQNCGLVIFGLHYRDILSRKKSMTGRHLDGIYDYGKDLFNPALSPSLLCRQNINKA